MSNLKIPGFLVLMFFFKSPAAQQNGSTLDPVTITSSLSQEKSSSTGRNIFVISGERFLNLPVHSIDELLRYLPGIEVQMRGPMGSQSDIVLRGGTFQQVLVILDGARLNDPNTGHFTSYIPIAPSEIERIEILKGASSAIYGSEAVGGVIHIITKSFSSKMGDEKLNAVAQVTAGKYEMFSLNAGVNFSKGASSVSAGLLSNHTSGQPQRGTSGFVHANTVSFSFGHFFSSRFSVQVRSAYDSRKFSAQNFYTNFVSDTADEKVRSFWNQLRLKYQGVNNTISLHIGYKEMLDQYRFNSASSRNKSTSRLFQILMVDEWKTSDRLKLIGGTQIISKRISSNDRGDHQVGQAALFAVAGYSLGNLNFSPGIRLEWNERSGYEFIPQVNISYRIDKMQIRASAGKTIRDADFTERFNNYQKDLVTSGRIGNPDLEAERSFSYEAGVDYFLAKEWKVSSTLFQRLHSRLIDYVVTSYEDMPRKVNLIPTGTYALAKNIAKVITTGFETDIQFIKQINSDDKLWISMGLLWLKSNSSESAPSFYITSHARFLSNLSLSYSTKRFSFGLTGLYKNRQPQESAINMARVSKQYFVFNISAECYLWKKTASVFVQGDNIFDTRFADLLGAQMPGRWLMGGIKITLSK